MEKVLSVFENIFLGGNDIPSLFADTSALFRDFSFQRLMSVLGNWFMLAIFVLYVAGLWKLFQKSGVKSWKALIPGLREYKLSRCAGREPEGRILFAMAILTVILNLIPSFANFKFSADERKRLLRRR